jgi:hypothetical protein
MDSVGMSSDRACRDRPTSRYRNVRAISTNATNQRRAPQRRTMFDNGMLFTLAEYENLRFFAPEVPLRSSLSFLLTAASVVGHTDSNVHHHYNVS